MKEKHRFQLFCLVIGLAILCGLLAFILVFTSKNSLLMHPKGVTALAERNLILLNYGLMFIIIIPTFVLLFVIALKYRAKNDLSQKHEPERTYGTFSEIMLWVVPSIIIAIMATITWFAAHKLDPFQPLKSSAKPIKIQVVALDWKWLFIYPEQGIATTNFVVFPAKTPVHFELAADGSPMNAFWIPELSGMIYAMAGMSTQLHVMANEVGEYGGRAAEINGRGLADMTFVAKVTSQSDFNKWVASAKRSRLRLTKGLYNELAKPFVLKRKEEYSFVEKDLFNDIVMKYMYPTAPVW